MHRDKLDAHCAQIILCFLHRNSRYGVAGELWWPESAACDTPNNTPSGHQLQTCKAQGTTNPSSTRAAARLHMRSVMSLCACAHVFISCACVRPCACHYFMCMCTIELCTEQPMIPTTSAFVVLQRIPNKQQEQPALLQLAYCAKCRSRFCSSVLSSPRQGVANLHEDFCHLQAQRVRSQGGQRY